MKQSRNFICLFFKPLRQLQQKTQLFILYFPVWICFFRSNGVQVRIGSVKPYPVPICGKFSVPCAFFDSCVFRFFYRLLGSLDLEREAAS